MKLFDRNKKRGQSISEYVVVISLISMCLVVMQLYAKRAVQARQNQLVNYYLDQAINQGVIKNKQYEPYYYARPGQDGGKLTKVTQDEEHSNEPAPRDNRLFTHVEDTLEVGGHDYKDFRGAGDGE